MLAHGAFPSIQETKKQSKILLLEEILMLLAWYESLR